MEMGWINTPRKSDSEPGKNRIAIGTKSAIELLLDDASSKEESESSGEDESNGDISDDDGLEKKKQKQ